MYWIKPNEVYHVTGIVMSNYNIVFVDHGGNIETCKLLYNFYKMTFNFFAHQTNPSPHRHHRKKKKRQLKSTPLQLYHNLKLSGIIHDNEMELSYNDICDNILLYEAFWTSFN